MYSFHRDSEHFLKTDNDIELLSGNHNLSRLNASEDTISRLNTTRNNIVYCIEKYQITIIATEVGIGILDLPQSLEDLGWIQKGKIAVIDRNCKTFMAKSENFQSKVDKICYLTNEEFLKELILDPILTNYGIIIVIDVHKRHILTDTVLALVKKIVRKRSSLKIVLVSNSREAIFFFEYFSVCKRYKHLQVTNGIISIDNVATKQNIFYLKTPCADYITKSIETLRKIHQRQLFDGDVLIYLSNEDEINQAIELLKNYISLDHIENINYFKLTHVDDGQESVFIPKVSGKRNVIFTINLNQNAVTQDRVCYVIDCGFVQLKWFDADNNKELSLIVPISKYLAELRAKWVNKYRKADVFRLFTKEDFNNFPEKPIAKMRRTDLCSVILYLKTLAIDNILRFDFPSPPPAKNVLSALETLYALGALDEKGQLTNPLGFFMADSPFCPHLSKVLFNSKKFHCSEEILTIVAMLQVESVFAVTNNNIADRHKQVAKRAFEAAEGDLITLLNIYTAFIENYKTKDFCRKYYLSYRNLMRVYHLRNYYETLLLKKYKIELISSQCDVEKILKCITSGYFMNVAYLHSTGLYRGFRSKSELFVDRNSSIYSLPQHKYLLYCTLYEKSKTFMHNLTVIKEEWLAELAPHYYKIH